MHAAPITLVLRPRLALAAALIALAFAASAQPAFHACGSLSTTFGPFDYRSDRDKLPIVENSHFTPAVEALIRGVSGPVGAELNYLLVVFPNHHRGLVAMTRLFERSKWAQPPGAKFSIDCYYDRALRFRPDDMLVRLLYASYLGKRNRNDEALTQLARAREDAGDNPITQFNVGLLYVDLKQYELARQQAYRVQRLGFTRPELVQRLQAAGEWVPPPADAASAAMTTPVPAAASSPNAAASAP
jgi:hypothetical protein